ncbi:Avr9/Cf-9 rapidly elicited protein [Melia azedarach]|uniref:Avr9/Cf-9 rapidly elicited protein n=1 Tax=Melia azedarach TaxID=155640 RepID=A0ACC1XAC1_MELAZ|nr:Avr9/Cf-9 rapidly elicited protein [Melia azedarach]
MEASPPVKVIAKKLCKMVRVILFIIQKGVTKTKLMLDLHLMMKRGKIIGKALNDAMLHQYSVISCRSHDMHASFVSPREYEFSCSNSPAYQPPYIPFNLSRRKSLHHKRQAAVSGPVAAAATYDDDVADSSPLVGPVRRRVRVTDSPFPLTRDDDNDGLVDKEAEEFIQRFYRQLRLQKSKAGDEAANIYG